MATAISYRHGTKDEHKTYQGVASEITVSTDELTLYVHNGDAENPQSVSLARADFNNVMTDTIKGKGILDNKLTNFRGGNYTEITNDKNPTLGKDMASYLDLIHQLGIKQVIDGEEVDTYAHTDLRNITTTEHLANRVQNPQNANDKSLAYADLSNVNVDTLTNESGDFKLAKLDLSNINNDAKNEIINTIENSNLGYATEEYVNNYVAENIPSIVGLEQTKNKIQNINASDSETNLQNNYPSVKAVLNYLDSGLNSKFLLPDLSNVSDWSMAIQTSDIFKVNASLVSPGSGYVADESTITTNISLDLMDRATSYLKILVREVDENGAILSFETDPVFTKTEIDESTPTTYVDSEKGASFEIFSYKSGEPGKLALADLTNTDALTKTLANNTYLKKSAAQTTYATKVNLSDHTSNTENPHNVTKAQVGLGNVDNTSDANKPISTATQNALNRKQATLVSGTNIKTINNQSILGNGNISVGSVEDAALAKTAVQPNDNISVLTNDAGFITKSVNNLDNYTKSSDLKTVATSGSYNDLKDRPSIPTITDKYNATSSNGMSGKAVASAISSFDNTLTSRNYISGVTGGTGIAIPTKIAIYRTSAEAQAASQADPTLFAFSLS